MKKITQKLFLLLSVLTVSMASAQLANYPFSVSTGNTLETGTFTTIMGSSVDDGSTGLVDMGFTFNFNGVNYTDFSVSSNGLLQFGAIATSDYTNTPQNLSGNYLIPYWDDNCTYNGGNIQYLIKGTPGSRKLIVEWNVAWLGDYNNGPDKHFQVWLYEGFNGIQFVYGAGNNSNDINFNFTGTSTGILQNGNTDYVSVNVVSNATSSVSHVINGEWPGAGKAYVFGNIPAGIVNTFLVGSSCGATISNLAVTIKTPVVTGASTYTFRVTNMATNAVFTVNRPVNSFALSNSPGVTLGTQYQIEVSTNNGATFGPPCLVNTPAPTTTIGNQCGTTLTSMGQWIYATTQSSITGYRFRVTNSATSAVEIYTAPNGLNKFNFNQLPAAFRMEATVYSVEVALRNTDGTYLPYGAACNITTSGNAPVITRATAAINEFVAAAYPNPFAENFMFNVTSMSENTIQITVYDMLGKQIENRNVEASDINSLQLGAAYNSGVYNVVVSQGDYTKTMRIIKR